MNSKDINNLIKKTNNCKDIEFRILKDIIADYKLVCKKQEIIICTITILVLALVFIVLFI